ncbi:C40 family peptidase [Streptomyces xantholiticus]|uniref:C40 family peptidase n=1 Tax=Streptomyces xantholiticus TaxID=68285 RepID=UPI001678F5AE|nr:C40 family peptidase [Streptomyces xantholiticus]GGW37924.1 glycoside hydrolase [Streptomyces xantholiticus]
MTAQMHLPLLFSRVGAVSALTIAALGGTLLAPGGTAQAYAISSHANKALKVAASKEGSPYRFGAKGPYRFDCSGLTLYSYKKAGKTLPRTAQQQYNRTRHVSASARKRGDLVFFHAGGFVYHVGIYAGGGRIWHSPKTGDVVRLAKIWTRSVKYGRVR